MTDDAESIRQEFVRKSILKNLQYGWKVIEDARWDSKDLRDPKLERELYDISDRIFDLAAEVADTARKDMEGRL